MTIAYIFPGQGSQAVGMGSNLAENFPEAREVFQEADEVLGFSLSSLCFNGPAEALQLTENTQPAILATSIAAYRALLSAGFPNASYVAGHSLGEYSALVASNSLSLSDALQIVKRRGRYMQEAVPVGSGAMAAVIGATLDTVESVCKEAAQGEVCSPANINSQNQIVIAGSREAVERATQLLKSRGVRKVVPLNVSAPFHCELMKPAQDRLSKDLAQTEFNDLQIPLVTNVDVNLITRGDEARDALIRQVSSSVRWLETIEFLTQKGVTQFVEVGPGKVLSGLVRQINRDVTCLNVEDTNSLESAGVAFGVLELKAGKVKA
jgi:[acyl-carrier-protein] S-malonyltransferase